MTVTAIYTGSELLIPWKMAEPTLIAFSSMTSRNALIFNDRIPRIMSGVFHVFHKYGDKIRSHEALVMIGWSTTIILCWKILIVATQSAMRNCINATNIRLLSITAARSCIGRDPKQIVIFERQRSLLFWSQLAPNQEVIVPKRAIWQQVDARVRDSSRLGRCVGTICHHVDPQMPWSLFGNHTDPEPQQPCVSQFWSFFGENSLDF